MTNDYKIVTEHLLFENWEQLFFVMIRTPDDLLRKRIEIFLQQYANHYDNEAIQETYHTLLAYVCHAQTRKRTTT